MLDDLKALMRSAPPAMRPARLYLADHIPRLPSSKLDVRSLMALDEIAVHGEHANVAATRTAGFEDSDRISRAVAHVWQQVLQTPVRGAADDFFEAGGDSLKGIAFVMDLERALDVEISLNVIVEAPKFGRLCEILRGRRATCYTPLVPLKAGTGLPPVFFVHDVGGSIAGLFPMARRMTYAGAVIGIQARGLSSHESPHATVEAMAAEYLREIKLWQPHGPYYLCGYSFGGLVAFEMARRLLASGDKVGLVGLFDTRISPRRWPFHCWLSAVRKRMVQSGDAVKAAPIYAWPAALWRIARGVYEELRSYATTAPEGQPLPSFLKHAPRRVLKVGVSALTASARYRPGFYPGELTLFTAVERDHNLPTQETIWSKHARTLRIVETEGTHSTMLSPPNAQSAASLLTRLLPVMKPAT